MDIIFSKIIPAILGFFAGVLGSIIAPWIKWGVEKKRERMRFRREQIKRWRDFIELNYDDILFPNTSIYSELRPHLSEKTIKSIEGNILTVREGRGGQVVKGLILDDISELEKKWKLI